MSNNTTKRVHFEPCHSSSQNSVKTVQFRPIEINTEDLEILIKTAHERSKINDDTCSMKHKDIVKLSKGFLKIVTKSANCYGKQNYSLDIEVEEKAPRLEEQNGFWTKMVNFHQPRKIFKVIDATIDPKVFQNQLDDRLDSKKKVVTLRVKCLVLITVNDSWTNSLRSFISSGTQNIINRTSSNYTNCSNCNVNMKAVETEHKCYKREDPMEQHNNQDTKKNVVRENAKPNDRREKDRSNVHREKERSFVKNGQSSGMTEPEAIGGKEGDRINTLSADLLEVKQKIVKIIESIADHAKKIKN
ncbi:hypothetical protein WDU94_015064 [Cyamophila willieti]